MPTTGRTDTTRHPPRDWRECPTAWFARLELARERREYESAAEALRELRRLGVIVKFTRAPKAGDA
ncbi:MAG: hypothetical protein AB7Q17_14235 [Phycisphaerae bacterium]